MTTKLPTFPTNHRKLKRIQQQVGPSCYAYAICGAMEAESKEYLNLDADEFHQRLTADGRAPHTVKALQEAKDKGVWCKSKKQYVKIKSFRTIAVAPSHLAPNLLDEIRRGKFPIMSLCIGSMKTFNQRIVDGVLEFDQLNNHAVVACDIGGDGLWVVFGNSWGVQWGKDGYAMIHFRDGKGGRKTIQKVYTLDL